MKQSSRYLTQYIEQDLKQKMVFVGGPRQVGKTTLAKALLAPTTRGYLNWDIPEHRERILKHEWPNVPFWVLDEIHKYSDWRQLLKGLYDQFGQTKAILVTGSARLDYYRHGGDSLQGRYHYLRMHPLSIAELAIDTTEQALDLLKLGGFPEPFFAGEAINAKRWSREYRQRLIQEDLATLERVKDLAKLELLMLRLPELVGSPLSIHQLSQDLQVAHATLANWLTIYERLYAIVRIPPFGAPRLRAVKKEQKHYHYDWTLINEQGLRFENMVAMHLLKWVELEQDTQARELSLQYFRDVDQREVDFVVVESGEPVMAIECKWNDADISKGLKYFKKHFPECEAWQLSMVGRKDYVSKEGIRVSSAITLLRKLC